MSIDDLRSFNSSKVACNVLSFDTLSYHVDQGVVLSKLMEFFYIFNVPSGHRFHVEVSLQWKVRQLQESVVQVTGIPVDDQVLLKHDGEVIDYEETVCNCCPENTAEAPVYLFQRSSKHDKEDNRLWNQEINEITNIIDISIENANQLEQDYEMHCVSRDIPHRVRECRSAAQSAIHTCARIAEEHRLMLRGWVALVSNLDSSVASLRKRAVRFLQQMEKVDQQKLKAADMLRNFDEVIDELKRIRLPGTLLAHCRGNVERSSFSDTSLYAWISASDPEHSLKELVDQVAEQFANFEQTDAKMAIQNIEKVMESSKNMNCREIKGINIRLSYLGHHLQHAEERGKKIEKHTSKIMETLSRVDQALLEEHVSQCRYLMGQIHVELKELRLICNRFFQSKLEFLRILRIRLNSWIARTYNRLHHAHNELLVFEEKCTGLKQRLDLIRQIKEAPIMYASAVTEVVRRKTFRREFNSWYSLHVERCSLLYDEESRIRAQFSAKMEKHFLRVLFRGMFDIIPPFFIKNLPEFDTALGPVDVEYLRELRKNIEELKQYLNVAVPQVFLRLEVRDPHAPSAAGSQGLIRREESFFTASPTLSLPMLSCNFPSTNWLSADDVNDSSPSTTPSLLMTKSPPSRVEPLSNLNMPITPSLNQLSMLGEEGELSPTSTSASVGKTAPIQIPILQPRQMSEKSSQFSTPEDHFHTSDPVEERQFIVDDLICRSQSSHEFLKHLATQINSISKDTHQLRADVSKISDYHNKELTKLAERISYLVNDRVTRMKNFYETELAERRKEHELVVASLRRRDAEVEELRRNCENSSWELDEKSAVIERLQNEVNALESKIGTMANGPCKNCIAEEPEKDKKTNSGFDEFLKVKYERVLFPIDLEKEPSKKYQPGPRTKGQELTVIEKKLEYERKLFQQKISFSMKWLAVERSRSEYTTMKASECLTSCGSSQIRGNSESVCGNSVASQTDYIKPRNGTEGTEQWCDEAIVVPVSPSTCSISKRSDAYIQTTIGLKTMDHMVAVEDIIEGSTVLVIWNDRHNAYMLFSSSAYNHFVKESSVRRLGLATIFPNIPRRNWILGKVSHLDLCVIRKADNRYRLPVETRVYRVDVEPLDVRTTRGPVL
ncbi:ATG11 domain-containing protein [Trichostrongylus colubriformis]|uniref:ATG11 domain-containing protein n=1 Tax=Trichostrongylus colubriformis TaxID=6319 RepID=A0AAN8J3M1_TRICO